MDFIFLEVLMKICVSEIFSVSDSVVLFVNAAVSNIFCIRCCGSVCECCCVKYFLYQMLWFCL